MRLENPHLLVVSGGPGSGKTTLLDELARRGFPYAPEVARQIIQEQTASAGRALPWDDREAYTRLMLERSVASFREHTPATVLTFCDRGIPDTLCYARLIGLSATALIESACRAYRYAPVVFLAPPWEKIYRTDNERRQDFTEAIRTFHLMSAVYAECGYRIVELPRCDVRRRADFVMEQMGGG